MDHWDLINRLASRRFQQEETAEEAALYVLELLARDDWTRVRTFSGKSKFSTFLSSVTYRLLEDYSRKRFGRVVPPKWVRDLGGIWLLLFRLLCLERFSFLDAVIQACTIRRDIGKKKIESSAEHLLSELPSCGKSIQQQEYDDEQIPSNENGLIHTAEEREESLISIAVSREIFGESEDETSVTAVRKLLGNKLDLKPDEQMLLRLRFREGLSVADIGKMLGLNRFQVNGRLRRVLEKTRDHFINVGSEEELKLLLK